MDPYLVALEKVKFILKYKILKKVQKIEMTVHPGLPGHLEQERNDGSRCPSSLSLFFLSLSPKGWRQVVLY